MRISDWSSDVCSSDLSSSERIPELLPELRVELVEVEALVLRPRVFDLERTHQVADAADGQPVAALLDAEDQAGAKGVAAAGGVGDAALVRGRHVDGLAVGVDHRALGAARGDVGLDPLGDLLFVQIGRASCRERVCQYV